MNNSSPTAIRALDVKKRFSDGLGHAVDVLSGVTFEARPGEVLAIVGASGSGKSTLLHILGGLDAPDAGEVFISGENIGALSDKALGDMRNRALGFVYQFHHLLPEFTALENVMIPALIAQEKRSVAEERAKEMLDFLRLSDRMTHKPAELSGGEKQRVAVARALINHPAVILADEPSGSLDTQHKEELHALFFELRDKMNQTFVIVTHDEQLATHTDRTIHIKDGKVI